MVSMLGSYLKTKATPPGDTSAQTEPKVCTPGTPNKTTYKYCMEKAEEAKKQLQDMDSFGDDIMTPTAKERTKKQLITRTKRLLNEAYDIESKKSRRSKGCSHDNNDSDSS